MSVSLENEDLRDLIKGDIPVRKCHDCEGSGFASYMHYTLKDRPHDECSRLLTPQQGADFCADDWPDFAWAEVVVDECDSCRGVGYVCSLWNSG
jgi:hypothetical protein